MNPAVTKILATSIMTLLISLGVSSYVIYNQLIASERLVSFRENIDAWDTLNRASVTLKSDEIEGASVSDTLRALVLEDEGDTIAFLSHVDDLGRRSGVEVSASELKSVKASDKGFDEIVAVIRLRGDSVRVDDMIVLLENLPYRSRIEELTLTRMNGLAEASVEMRVGIVE
mgnify:CR=1 FL=1|jgi:hypothetical protein